MPVFDDSMRLEMQIAFGRVRRKTAPTGPYRLSSLNLAIAPRSANWARA